MHKWYCHRPMTGYKCKKCSHSLHVSIRVKMLVAWVCIKNEVLSILQTWYQINKNTGTKADGADHRNQLQTRYTAQSTGDAHLLESWLPHGTVPFHQQSLENERLLHRLCTVSTWHQHQMLHSPPAENIDFSTFTNCWPVIWYPFKVLWKATKIWSFYSVNIYTYGLQF